MKRDLIPLFSVFMNPYAPDHVGKVLMSGFIGQGPKVIELEEYIKSIFGMDCLLTNSATSAEHLVWDVLKTRSNLHSPRLERGDEVLTTALSCTATNWPIVKEGLRIKWVDIDPDNLNMDLDDLERKITPSTKAIQVMHWSGIPTNLDRINEIREKCFYKFGFMPVVVEDCAHAMGSRYKGKLIGTHGNICTFSLQAIKHLTSVDGGFVIFPDEEQHRMADLIKWYGLDRRSPRTDFRCENDCEFVGTKWHMNDVSATVGLSNFPYMNTIVEWHKSNAAYYDKELSNVPGVTLLKRDPDSDPAFWIYSMLVEDRPNFVKMMTEKGIMVSQVHERNDKHSCVSEFKSFLPTLDRTIGKLTHIPCNWSVSEEERDHIVSAIKSGW